MYINLTEERQGEGGTDAAVSQLVGGGSVAPQEMLQETRNRWEPQETRRTVAHRQPLTTKGNPSLTPALREGWEALKASRYRAEEPKDTTSSG